MIVCNVLDMLDIKSLGTWRKSKFVDHKKKAKSLKSLRRLDIFNSSPSLVIQDRSDNSASSSWWTSRKWSDTTPRKSSMQTDLPSQVLQFTSKEQKLIYISNFKLQFYKDNSIYKALYHDPCAKILCMANCWG